MPKNLRIKNILNLAFMQGYSIDFSLNKDKKLSGILTLEQHPDINHCLYPTLSGKDYEIISKHIDHVSGNESQFSSFNRFHNVEQAYSWLLWLQRLGYTIKVI
jgi:hypothetical protein